MTWQQPTSWSTETPDGGWYAESVPGGWALYRKHKFVARFAGLAAAKAFAEAAA